MSNNRLGHCMGMAICLLSGNAAADHPAVAFGIDGAGPIGTISANTLPAKNYAFGIQTELIDNDRFSTGKLENFAAGGLVGVHSIDRISTTSVSFSYGVTDDFSVNARLPYIRRQNIRESEIENGTPEAHAHGDSAGPGDALLLGHYRVFKDDTTAIAVNFGAKLPTGQTDEIDRDGVRFETEFQPGSGSWDTLLGLAVRKKYGSFGYHANILYNRTSEGSQSTEIGNALSYNAAITYMLHGENHATHDHDHNDALKWDLMLELNGERRGKNKISGIRDPHSGGNSLFLAPGIRVSTGRFGGFVSYGVPVIERQNGKQTDVERRIVAGMSFVL